MPSGAGKGCAIGLRTRHRAAAAFAAGVSFASLLVGCTSNSKPAMCSDIDGLQKSVQSLGDVQLGTGAVAEVRDKLTTISTQFDTFKADAKSEFSDDISKVQSAIDKLSTSLTAAKENPSGASLAAAGTAAKGVADATASLATAVRDAC
jgi:hypothetical protein